MALLNNIRTGLEDVAGWIAGSDEDVPVGDMTEAMEKAGMGMASQPAATPPRSMFHDPYSVMDWGGWRQRPSSVTYETLRQMSVQSTVIAAIIQLRTDQVASFCRPQQGRYDRGFRIVLRDRRDKRKGMSKAEQKEAAEIERFLETTGLLMPNEKPSDRDSFRSFNKKAVRDILTYDQWCNFAGTLVMMADGTQRPIESIQPGEEVITHKGRVRRVTDVMSRPYSGRAVELNYRGGTYRVTDGHPIYAAPSLRGKLSWMPAGELRRGHYAVAPLSESPQRPVSAPWGNVCAEDAWVIGRYVADGFLIGAETRFSISDEVTLDRIEQWADRVGWRSVITEDGPNCWLVRLTGQPNWSQWLADTCGQGAPNKRLPREILDASTDLIAASIAGLLDGDGYWKGTSCVLSTTSLDLLSTVRLACARLGFHVTWSETTNASQGWASCWQARFSGPAFREAMKPHHSLEIPSRESQLVVDGGYTWLPLQVKHFEVEDEQVFNLEVEEDHSYIANGIASHNCWERIRDQKGRPSRFVALPSETIRPAVVDFEHMDPAQLRSRVTHVQVYENTVIAEFGLDDIAWCVKNPRSDLRVNGFGFSPIEQLIRLVTAWLFGFEYNTKFFTQGSAVKGLLNIKGAIPDRQMRAFRRMWYSMISGVQNAWKTPILNADDIQWHSMHTNNREMEYSQWMDWLTKLICALFGVDPVEINFIFGSNAESSMFDRRPNQAEVTESKDKGLRPLLEHIEEHLNKYMVWEINPDFEFSFTGFDASAEERERKARSEEVKSFKTVNEARTEMDEEPLPDDPKDLKPGDYIDSPQFLQWIGQLTQQQEGGEEGGMPGGGGEDEDDPFAALMGGGEGEDEDDEGGGNKGDSQPSKSDSEVASQSGGEESSQKSHGPTEKLRKSPDGRMKFVDIWIPNEG